MTDKKTDYKSIEVTKEEYRTELGGLWTGGIEYKYYTGNTPGPLTNTITVGGCKSKKQARQQLHDAMKKTVAASRSKNFMELRIARGWNG